MTFMDDSEVWKDAVGYVGFYQVSDFGKVRSVSRLIRHPKGGFAKLKGKVLCPTMAGGYYLATLSVDGVVFYELVHRMVAKAFIHNPDEKPQVNHKDGNK